MCIQIFLLKGCICNKTVLSKSYQNEEQHKNLQWKILSIERQKGEIGIQRLKPVALCVKDQIKQF